MDSWDNPAYEAALAYQKTAALTAAIKLDVFALIGGGVRDQRRPGGANRHFKPRDADSVRLSHRHGSAEEAEWSL